MCCHGAETPGTGPADFIWLIHFFLRCRKKQRLDGDFVPRIAMSVLKAVGIEIPKVILHLADWHCRNIDSEAA